MFSFLKRKHEDRCERCLWYHPSNGTCNIKKCAGFGCGYVSQLDRRSCELCAPRGNSEAEWQHQ